MEAPIITSTQLERFRLYSRRTAEYILAQIRAAQDDFDAIEAMLDRIAQGLVINAYERLQDWELVLDYFDATYDMLSVRGYWRESLAWGEIAIEAARALGDNDAVIRNLRRRGQLLAERGEHTKAQQCHEASLALLRNSTTPRPLDEAHALHQFARIAYEQTDFVEARARAKESLTIREREEDLEGIADTHELLGLIAMDAGDYADAEEHLEKSEPIRRQIDDPVKLAILIQRKGILAEIKGDLVAAQACMEESLKLQQILGEQRGMAATHQLLGVVAQNQGDLARAKEHLLSSIEIWEQQLGRAEGGEVLQDSRGRARALAQLGTIYAAEGQEDEARNNYTRARDAFHKLNDLGGLAGIEMQLGNLAFANEQYDDANRHYTTARQLFIEVNDRAGMAGALYQLGLTARASGLIDDAYHYLRESLALAEALEDRQGQAMCRHQIGILASQRGDLADAWNQFDAALALWQAVEERARLEELAGILHDLGQQAEKRRNHTLANAIHHRNLLLRGSLGMRRDRAATLHHLGLVAQAQGDYDQAESHYSHSLAIKRDLQDHEGIALTLYSLAWLTYERGDRDMAIELMTESLSLFEQSGSSQASRARSALQRMNQSSTKVLSRLYKRLS